MAAAAVTRCTAEAESPESAANDPWQGERDQKLRQVLDARDWGREGRVALNWEPGRVGVVAWHSLTLGPKAVVMVNGTRAPATLDASAEKRKG